MVNIPIKSALSSSILTLPRSTNLNPRIPRQGPATAREWSHVMYDDEFKHMSDIGAIDNVNVVPVVVHGGH